MTPQTSRAATDKELQRVKGVIGYQQTDTAPFTQVVGRFLLPDDYTAVTRDKAAALLTLPDSSLVGLGENTRVQVGAFNQTAAGPGATITVNGGTLRFDVKRPQGATANYRFVTPTTQIAVRGTIGLLSFVGGNTSVACVVCAADSVSVTVGTQTFTLLSGQLLTVTAAGAVVTGAVTGTVMSGFSAAGVSTSASTGAAAATAGVSAGTTAAAAAAAGTTTGLVAAGAVAAAAAGVQASTTTSTAPQQLTTPQPGASASASASPVAAATQPGTIGINGRRGPAAAVTPAAEPPTAAPTLAPPRPALPGGRLGR